MTAFEMKIQFCKRIFDLRTESELSLPELARRSGLSLAMLEELERGIVPKRMMVADAWKLAGVFGRELHELFR